MTSLQRHLGIRSAVLIGLAAMIGAGVFFVWAPAAAAAGAWLPLALVIAAVIATINAFSTAQLAASYPVAGGAYSFGRRVLGEWPGFAAGWLFLWGKTASAAAIASIAGAYLWPQFATPVAIAVVIVLAAVNASGIRSTARVSAVIVAIVLVGLAVVIAAPWLTDALGLPVGQGKSYGVTGVPAAVTPMSILQASALIFFAFAGYARMATLAEEARNPKRTLPIAIAVALGITLAVYAIVMAVLLSRVGVQLLASVESPLATAAIGWTDPFVKVIAGIACIGSLLGVLAGLSRTSLAMARGKDLPEFLARVSPRTSAPIVAEVTIAVLAVIGILVFRPAQLVAVSSCAVLGYYLIANLAASRQPREERWFPPAISLIGVVGCAVLAVTLPPFAIATALGVLALGVVLRMLRTRAES